jgi:2-polyprenyl-3-methyl-5-hydroxy-6-metoxy-1,4-benzoquinol methylase
MSTARNEAGVDKMAALYDQEYYQSHLGPLPYNRESGVFVDFFIGIAESLIRTLQPATVLDAGCAMGFLVEAFWDRGVKAWGIDISQYAISKVRRDMQPYCRVGSLADPISGTYDLVTCIEVLEHMPEAAAIQAIANLASTTDTILFSSSPTDFTEPTHVNVHQSIWWLEQFQNVGFSPDLTFDASFVAPQTMLLRRSSQPRDSSVLRLFSEWLRLKAKIAAAEDTVRRLADQRRSEGTATDTEPAVRTEIQELKAEVNRLDERVQSFEQLAERAEERALVFLKEIEASARERERVECAIANYTMRGDWDSNSQRSLVAKVEANSGKIHSLEPRIEDLAKLSATLHQEMEDVNTQVKEILSSRIWRALVRSGGVLLKLAGRES